MKGNVPWGTVSTFLVYVWFCWRADIVSFEPEPSVLYDLFMPTLLFSRVPLSPWRMNIKVEMGIFRFFCLPYFSPYSFLVPLFTCVPFYFHCLFLAKFRPSGHWCWSFSCVPNSFLIYVDIPHFPLFGSWHFLIWPLFSPLSLPLLVSSVSFLSTFVL